MRAGGYTTFGWCVPGKRYCAYCIAKGHGTCLLRLYCRSQPVTKKEEGKPDGKR